MAGLCRATLYTQAPTRTADGGRMRRFSPARQSLTRVLAAVLTMGLIASGLAAGPAVAAPGQTAAANAAVLTTAEVTPDDLADMFIRDATGRVSTPAEREKWGAKLSSGTPPQVVFDQLLDSTDIGGPFVPVVRLYRATFLRPPKQEGVAYWVRQARSGESLEEIATVFAKSPEFVNRYGNLSNGDFIDQIYLNILGRPAKADGKAYWEGLLKRGVPRGNMIVNFSEASENVKKTSVSARMSLLTATMLRRQATEDEVAKWQTLWSGLSDTELIRRVMNSAAYKQRLGRNFTKQHPLTGQWSRKVEQRPALAVKIDNVAAARPQYGINSADIVYEAKVEGNLTRLIAVFHSQQPKTVGPVRSIRTTDFDVLAPFRRPLLAASGANGEVLRQLRQVPVINANALQVPGAYWRLSSRSAPNNLMATASTLWGRSPAGATAPPTMLKTGLPASSGKNTGGVNIEFGRASVSWTWSKAQQQWRRTQNGKRHVDQNGLPIGAENVIVMATKYGQSSADSASPHGKTVGTGRALIFTNGTVIDGKWTRTKAADPIKYVDGNGRAVTLRPGQTWIELAPIGSFSFRKIN